MQKLLMPFAVLVAFSSLAAACPTSHSGKFRKRRKRNVGDEVTETAFLRTYMTRCTEDLYDGAEYDWETNVNYAVLHSNWFKNSDDVYCSPSGEGPTVQCWQQEVNKILNNATDDVVETVKTCIEHYGADRNSDPPLNRYENTVRRRKRQLPTARDSSYAGCLGSDDVEDDPSPELNYEALSLFMEDQVADPCSEGAQPSMNDDPNLDWTNRFIALTRPDSMLRTALRDCTEEYFPPPDYWASWGPWSECSSSCMSTGEEQFRQRECLSGTSKYTPANGCEGNSKEQRTCMECGNDSQIWSQWSPFSHCTSSCGGGELIKSRKCLMDGNTVAANLCSGPAVFTVSCNTQTCPTTTDQRCPPLLDVGCFRPDECSSNCEMDQICCPTPCGTSCADVSRKTQVFPDFNVFL